MHASKGQGSSLFHSCCQLLTAPQVWWPNSCLHTEFLGPNRPSNMDINNCLLKVHPTAIGTPLNICKLTYFQRHNKRYWKLETQHRKLRVNLIQFIPMWNPQLFSAYYTVYFVLTIFLFIQYYGTFHLTINSIYISIYKNDDLLSVMSGHSGSITSHLTSIT